MKNRDEVRREIVEQWRSKADIDLAAAETLSGSSDALGYPIAFHAQQAAEKYLKAYLTHYSAEFRKTDDLGALLDVVAAIDPAPAADLDYLIELNPYGVEARYPGDLPEVTGDEAAGALSLARECAERVAPELPEV